MTWINIWKKVNHCGCRLNTISTDKTDRHEILLKVALNTITLTLTLYNEHSVRQERNTLKFAFRPWFRVTVKATKPWFIDTENTPLFTRSGKLKTCGVYSKLRTYNWFSCMQTRCMKPVSNILCSIPEIRCLTLLYFKHILLSSNPLFWNEI